MQSKHKAKGNSEHGSAHESVRPLASQRLARQSSSFESDCDGEHDDTHRFALGTREMRPVTVPQMTDDGEPWSLSQASYDLELASVPHAMFVINTKDQIEYVNELAASLAGYTQTEMIGQSVGSIVSKIRVPVAETRAQRTSVRFVPAESGVSVHHRDGRDMPASVVLSPQADGSVIALVTPLASGIALDDSHESRVAELVHDFKNPLSTIALEMYLLDDKLKDDAHRELHGVVARVSRNVEYLDRLVQDLLDSCAIAAGELVLRRRPTELCTLLEQVVDRAVPTRDRARVVLQARSMITLAIDDLRIERVVSNLLQNALKYAPRKSTIVVRLELTADQVRISVIDSGGGISPHEQSYIFDKYRRTTRAQGSEGSGIGLYVSKQIVEAHGGRMGVISAHGTGSRFFFELPRM
jgi:PAS domain S-box-containing protein